MNMVEQMKRLDKIRMAYGNSQYLIELAKLSNGYPSHDNFDYESIANPDFECGFLLYDFLLRNMSFFFLRMITALQYRTDFDIHLPKICMFKSDVFPFIEWCKDTNTNTIHGEFITEPCHYDPNVVCIYWLPYNLSMAEYDYLMENKQYVQIN